MVADIMAHADAATLDPAAFAPAKKEIFNLSAPHYP